MPASASSSHAARDTRRPAASWVLMIFLVLSVLVMLLGQTVSVFNYDWTVQQGLQEGVEAVGPYGVQVNRAFGAGDTVVYIPLMVLAIVGLWRRKRWALAATGAVAGISAYWSATILFMLWFLPGVPGYHNVPGPEIWTFVSIYLAFGLGGLGYLLLRGATLVQDAKRRR